MGPAAPSSTESVHHDLDRGLRGVDGLVTNLRQTHHPLLRRHDGRRLAADLRQLRDALFPCGPKADAVTALVPLQVAAGVALPSSFNEPQQPFAPAVASPMAGAAEAGGGAAGVAGAGRVAHSCLSCPSSRTCSCRPLCPTLTSWTAWTGRSSPRPAQGKASETQGTERPAPKNKHQTTQQPTGGRRRLAALRARVCVCGEARSLPSVWSLPRTAGAGGSGTSCS